MVEGLLDATTLRQLFSDLASSAIVLGVREKNGPKSYTGIDELTPELALLRLLSGEARSVQIRYRFDDHEWTDTIMTTPNGFRAVRCRHDD